MADPIASFQGLATGINFRDLVDQIIVNESRPARLLENRIVDLQRRAGAMDQVKSLVGALEDAAERLAGGTAFDGFQTSMFGLADGELQPFSVSTTGDATPGSYSVSVLQLAQSERLGGTGFTSSTEALGLSGEFRVGGRVVSVGASDSLQQIVDRINSANSGSDASRVSASILSTSSTDYRLVLSDDDTGAAGIDLVDGTDGVLRSLGLIESTTSIKSATSDGAKSDGFISANTTLGSLLGWGTPPASGAVTIGGLSVTLDLSTQSLSDIATAINDEAALQSSAITAAVVQETDADGNTVNRLDISGTTAFTDANGILESLGVLEGDRGAVAQQVQSGNAFTDGDAVTVATAATTLANTWVGGANAAVQVGDTFDFTGTRGDGTTFTKTFTVAGGETFQDVLDSLNAVDAFGGGGQTATASMVNGQIVVTDDTSGESRLDFSVVSNNQGGGTFDFGESTVATTGRSRQLASGTDAQVEINGAFITSATNSITGVLDGVSFDVNSVRESPLTVSISRDVSQAVSEIQTFVNAVNAIEDYAAVQFSGTGSEDGEVVPALSGSVVLRQIRSDIRNIMNTTLGGTVSGSYSRMADIGIEFNQDGRYDLDANALESALNTSFTDVEGLFTALGSTSNTSLEYIASTSDTQAGTYEVVVSQAATKASHLGVGFGGTYVDDGTADTLTLLDVGTGAEYSVSLNNGDTLADIIDRLNTELATSAVHMVQASGTLYSDAVGTPATESTTLDSLFDGGGTNFGVAQDDVITLSGTGANGEAVFREIVVGDPATQTLGDIKSDIELELNAEVNITVENGVLTFTAKEAGVNPISLTLASDNAGGGTLTFGTLDATTVGRGTSSITASDVGGQLQLEHATYGSVEGFEISFTAGGTDGSASLGLTAGSYTGLDVAGTIGGLAATGTGTLLTGAADTAVDGLAIRYSDATTGSVGSLTFSRGIASLMEVFAEPLISGDDGSIDDLVSGIEDQVETIQSRIDNLDDRMARRRESLIRRFTALESAISVANSQAQFFLAQLGSLPSTGGGLPGQ